MTEMISNSGSQYLNKYMNTLNNRKINSNKNNSKGLLDLSNNKTGNMKQSSNSSKVGSQTILAKRGQAGYLKQMDLDEDGKISLEEFNEYCETNGIDGKAKLEIFTAMMVANTNSKIAKETTTEEDSKKDANSIEDKAVYAKEGDEKYDEAMDENNNGVVTYAEYLKYMNEKDKSKSNKETEKTATEENPSSQNNKQDKISEAYSEKSETQSMIEYDV